MKVGILLISDGYAGAENAVYHLVKEFLKKKVEVVLITNQEMINNYTSIKGLNLINIGEIFSKNIFSRILLINKFQKKIKETILKEKVDIQLLFLEYSYLFYAPLYSKLNAGVFSTLRGSEINEYIKPHKLLIKYLLNKSFNYSSKILAVSQDQLRFLQEKYKSKTIVIPNGVDSAKFKLLNNVKKEKKIILYTGRYIERKGIKEVISVAKQLPQYEFWFAGQGLLKNLISLPNTKNLGFKTTGELIQLYNKATITIMPSYWEGFSNVGLEASSCGSAIVATNEGFGEYFENKKDALLIPAKDETALKNAIVDLMTNEKKRKMLEKNARKKALQYSWDKVAEQYLKVFKEAVRE